MTIESTSPVRGEQIWLRVSPTRVVEVSPARTVVSLPLIDPNEADIRSIDAIWNSFCHHSFFFPRREEAERWAAGREDIEILTVDEASALGRQFSSRLLAHVT